MLYLRARYYHPALGVFTALDPVENVNRYQYVSANPVNRVDPVGLYDPPPPLAEKCKVTNDPFGEFICQMCMDFDDPIEQQVCESIVALIIAGAGKVSTKFSPYILTALTRALTTPQGLLISTTAATAALTAYVCVEGGQTGDPLIDLLTCGSLQPYSDTSQLRPPTAPAPAYDTQSQPAATRTPTPGTMATTAVEQDPTACPTPVPTPTPQRACDPQAFEQWWLGFPQVPGRTDTASYSYEQRVCRAGGGDRLGDYPRNVSYGGVEIAADGIDPDTCRLLECKHSETPDHPRLRRGGDPRVVNQLRGELLRYSIMVNTVLPGVRPLGLEVRTNSGLSKDYAESLFENYGLMSGVNAWAIELE